MHRTGIVLRSQLNPYLIRLCHFAAIFLMSLIGAVAMAVFVLLMSASAACAEGLPMETSGADVDLAIVDYILEDMGPFHRLSMTVANMGSDSLAHSFDIGMEVKIRTDFSQVSARHEEVVSLPVELPPGGLREFSVEWDGRDEAGWAMAGGAYFYRLRLGEYAQTRRLMRLN